ncbi:protein of unknown function [Candidatus Methylomirabilis oxygeniifera]|uniref:Uncharacterized protein n=1 Tax=Methylomirabilis oxygeniifera TaxID=671143 RepID=D5MGY6_METO1|nr:protein of unknown function [Candidatus Methylomirabilis oxyfera]
MHTGAGNMRWSDRPLGRRLRAYLARAWRIQYSEHSRPYGQGAVVGGMCLRGLSGCYEGV